MYVYIDASGKISEKQRQVHVALCMPREANRHLPGLFFKLQKEIYGVATSSRVDPYRTMEFKAEQILNQSTFSRALSKGVKDAQKFMDGIERIFDELSLPEFADVTIFAVIFLPLNTAPVYIKNFLPEPLRFLLQRVNLLMIERYPDRVATVIFDANNELLEDDKELLSRFSRHWNNKFDGDNFQKHITPTPFFVDSQLTPGIQVADLIAGCLRLCWENNLIPSWLRPEWDKVPEKRLSEIGNDPLLPHLKRYLAIILTHTRDIGTNPKHRGIYVVKPESFRG